MSHQVKEPIVEIVPLPKMYKIDNNSAFTAFRKMTGHSSGLKTVLYNCVSYFH